MLRMTKLNRTFSANFKFLCSSLEHNYTLLLAWVTTAGLFIGRNLEDAREKATHEGHLSLSRVLPARVRLSNFAL